MPSISWGGAFNRVKYSYRIVSNKFRESDDRSVSPTFTFESHHNFMDGRGMFKHMYNETIT